MSVIFVRSDLNRRYSACLYDPSTIDFLVPRGSFLAFLYGATEGSNGFLVDASRLISVHYCLFGVAFLTLASQRSNDG